MKNCFPVALAFLVLAIGVTSAASAEDKPEHKPAHRIEMLDDKAMEKLKPGSVSEQNSIFAPLVGTWDVELNYWSGRDAQPQLSTGTATNEMMWDNRFLSSKLTAQLNIGGQVLPYEGLSFVGYDAAKKAYTSALMETMRTGVMTGAGQYDDKTKTLEEKGSFTHPLIDKERKFRSELALADRETHKRTVFITDAGGKEYKVLEIEYRRHR